MSSSQGMNINTNTSNLQWNKVYSTLPEKYLNNVKQIPQLMWFHYVLVETIFLVWD